MKVVLNEGDVLEVEVAGRSVKLHHAVSEQESTFYIHVAGGPDDGGRQHTVSIICPWMMKTKLYFNLKKEVQNARRNQSPYRSTIKS